MLPKIHRANNPGRPTVNGIGCITQRILAYTDQQIRPLAPRIPSYIKATTHLFNHLLGQRLTPGDLLVTIDINSLYTNITHNEGIKALNRSLEEVNTGQLKKVYVCPSSNNYLTSIY